MIGMSNPPALHALLRRAYPNDRTVELAISARAAGSQFAIQRMLAHDVCAMQTLFPHLPAVIK